MAVERLGTVWVARARLCDDRGNTLATCIDTPNAIGTAMGEHPEIAQACTGLGWRKRAYYADRMATGCKSGYMPAVHR